MSREETFIIATLFSVTGVAAEFYGADVPEWVFPVSSLVLVVVISLAILPVIIRSQSNREANSEKPRTAFRSAGSESSPEDQKTKDRKAMEALINRHE